MCKKLHTLYTNHKRETSLKILKNTIQGRHYDTLPNSQENLENEEDNRVKFSFKERNGKNVQERFSFECMKVSGRNCKMLSVCSVSSLWTEHIFDFPDLFAFEGGAGHMSRQGGALKIAVI